MAMVLDSSVLYKCLLSFARELFSESSGYFRSQITLTIVCFKLVVGVGWLYGCET